MKLEIIKENDPKIGRNYFWVAVNDVKEFVYLSEIEAVAMVEYLRAKNNLVSTFETIYSETIE